MTNGGCTKYAEATVSIFFELNHVACQYCPLLTEAPRWQCRRTGEYLFDTKMNTGYYCPLKFNEDRTD